MFPNLVIDVLRGTPVWVFVVFAILLSVSLQQLRPNLRTLRRILIVPIFFTGWGLLGLFERSASAGVIAAYWVPAALLGALIATRISLPMKIDRGRGLVWQPGNVISLVRNMVLFLGHYLLRVAAVMHPHAADSLMNWEIAVSGLGTGYFVAWGIRFAQAYARAPETDLGGPAAYATAAMR